MARKILFKTALIVMTIFVVGAQPALAADIVLDGAFDDWADQPHVGDPSGDALSAPTDLAAFYFATNPNQEMIYFMAERWQASGTDLTLELLMDTNNDGVYTDYLDRRLVINYDILKPRAKISVELYDGTGAWLQQVAKNNDWGENNPGARVEWGVSFAALGIVPFQTVRMELRSLQGSSVSDSAPEVQFSPANALGWPLLALLVAAGVVILYIRRRKLK